MPTAATEAVDEPVGIVAGTLQMLKLHPVFFGVSFVTAMAMGLYFAFTALYLEDSGVRSNLVGPVMTIGQMIEIFFMLTLPWFLGPQAEGFPYMKWVLMVGICAWSVRFGLFSIGKPLVLEEFGLARDWSESLDNHDLKAPTFFRDRFFARMFDEVFASVSSAGPLSGDTLWAWGGRGRPGTPWLGDPPHERPGWYSVFDSDASTLEILASHAARMESVGPTD